MTDNIIENKKKYFKSLLNDRNQAPVISEDRENELKYYISDFLTNKKYFSDVRLQLSDFKSWFYGLINIERNYVKSILDEYKNNHNYSVSYIK